MPPKKRFITCEICENRASRSNHEKRMFMARFPLDEARCKQWVKFVGKEDLIYVPIEKLHTLKYVCGNHFHNRAFNKEKNRLKNCAIPSKNLKADPLPDEMLLEFPCHIYSNIDITTTKTSQGIIDNEASLFQAGPSNLDSCTAGQQLLAQESTDKKEIQSRKRKPSLSSGSDNTILHKFPNPNTDQARFHTWLYAIGGNILVLDNKSVHKYRKVCHSHFEAKYHTYSRRLTANAVPTLHLKGTASIAPKQSTTSAKKQSDNYDADDNTQECDIADSQPSPVQEFPNNYDADDNTQECDIADSQPSPVQEFPKDEIYSWQRETEDELDDIPDNLSMYCDDKDTSGQPAETVKSRNENPQLHEEFQCNACNGEIIGYRYTCVQCSDLDLCSACEASGAHDQHYVLRVPQPRPHTEVQTVLATIRRLLLKELDPVSTSLDDDVMSVKSEVKSEGDIEETHLEKNPLSDSEHTAGAQSAESDNDDETEWTPKKNDSYQKAKVFTHTVTSRANNEQTLADTYHTTEKPSLPKVFRLTDKSDKGKIVVPSTGATLSTNKRKKIIIKLTDVVKVQGDSPAKKICLVPCTSSQTQDRPSRIRSPNLMSKVKLLKLPPGVIKLAQPGQSASMQLRPPREQSTSKDNEDNR